MCTVGAHASNARTQKVLLSAPFLSKQSLQTNFLVQLLIIFKIAVLVFMLCTKIPNNRALYVLF